jgi:prolyl 4-hydroxylase
MLNIQDLSLKGSGETLRSMIWDGTKIILKQWTGVELSPTSLYGVRVYTDGAVLAPHVDRNPLVISAIINVAQDVREDWPLEVIAHDGNAYNITMDVGDMILYESHSVIHGRPFPLNGDYYANVFCHFEPLERSLIDRKSVNHRFEDSLKTLYQDAWDRQRRLQKRKCGSDKQCFEHEFVDLNTAEKMPYYIVPKSREGKRWTLAQPDSQLVCIDRMIPDFLLHQLKQTFTSVCYEQSKLPKLNLIAHAAAAGNDLKALMHIAEADLNRIMEIDANGWVSLSLAWS